MVAPSVVEWVCAPPVHMIKCAGAALNSNMLYG